VTPAGDTYGECTVRRRVNLPVVTELHSRPVERAENLHRVQLGNNRGLGPVVAVGAV
jgi:hypothetical protein